MKEFLIICLLVGYTALRSNCQSFPLDTYNEIWDSQSKNSSESMPCGGGDIGLNVWVEQGDILFYIAKSGFFDENNGLLKAGRIRLKLSPNPFASGYFKQELKLREGYIQLEGGNSASKTIVKIWVDVYRPVVHAEISSIGKIALQAGYESWRYENRPVRKGEGVANSYKWVTPAGLMTLRDEIGFVQDGVQFFHRNQERTIFDLTVQNQGMESVKEQLFNPLKNLTFGGAMTGKNLVPAGNYEGKYADTEFRGWLLKSKTTAKTHSVEICLYGAQTANLAEWHLGLQLLQKECGLTSAEAHTQTLEWWKKFWDRSFVGIGKPSEPEHWKIGKNYQLFRYMLGCNAFGTYPTKFNGGLFTVDPCFTDTNRTFTPDFRNWGGGTFTAQNQRLVYFPMLKSGDFELMKPQFDFYLRILKNAELRSRVYWNHSGACFTEQMENFGLPNLAEYGTERPAGYNPGVEYNPWLEYEWDTCLEFCLMMLEVERYSGTDIRQYIPFIESCLTFFDEHYTYLAKSRGSKWLDADGHLILYPGSACETYKMTTNSSATIAGLTTILKRLLELPEGCLSGKEKDTWQAMLKRIPPISTRFCGGVETIAPAKSWERINNVEVPQLYPLFPWGIYGFGKPNMELALSTWQHDPDAIKNRSPIGWKQDNIFAARLGLTEEASRLTFLKMADSGRRFPAFWGPGFDWTPDHNWGGSGMIGLQEMLLQVDGDRLHLLPAWPESLDVHCKLHAPRNTTIELILTNGKIKMVKILPEERKKDIASILKKAITSTETLK